MSDDFPGQPPPPALAHHQHHDFHRAGLPSVLLYLQREWGNFERERTRWACERAELQARIGFLEGQRKADAGIRHDLLCRIKMLEFALNRERAKNRGEEFKQPSPNTGAGKKQEAPGAEAAKTNTTAQREAQSGREILVAYLQEMGYTDAVIHAQAKRLKALSPGWPPASTSLPPAQRQSHVPPPPSAASPGRDSGEDEADDDEEVDEMDFLAEMEDLANQLENDPPMVDREEPPPNFGAKDDAQAQPTAPPASTAAAESVPDEQDEAYLEEQLLQKFGKAGSKVLKKAGNKKKSRKVAGMGRSAGGKPRGGLEDLFGGAEPEAGEAVAAQTQAAEGDLGELAEFSIANDTGKTEPDEPTSTRKAWVNKYILRSHYDSVRDVAFHPSSCHVFSASEDKTVKIWTVDPTAKRAVADTEPFWTLRGHRHAVLSVTVSFDGNIAYSGDAGGSIRSWSVPEDTRDKYDPLDRSLAGPQLTGHADAVWSLSHHPFKERLLSVSSDSTCCLWDTEDLVSIVDVWKDDTKTLRPTRAEFVKSDPDKVVVALNNGDVLLIDAETSTVLSTFTAADAGAQANGLATHTSLGMAVSGHEDKTLRFHDLKAGETVHSMTAHQDGVTGVAFESSGLNVVTGGHDRSLRFWDIGTKNCVDEVSCHRCKQNESVIAVACHPTLPVVASAGADATIRVFL
eukprot:m.484095 g.484095  ORF g.484095 m.484095 type:complete len:685 (+) comp23202_c0_seq1:373-2427(+)